MSGLSLFSYFLMDMISPITLMVPHHPHLITRRQSSGFSQIIEYVELFLLLLRSTIACHLSISPLLVICGHIFKVSINSWVILTLLLSIKIYMLLIKVNALFRNTTRIWRIWGVNWLLWKSLYVKHAPLVIMNWYNNVCEINNLYFSSWLTFVLSTRRFRGRFSIDHHYLL